MSDNIIYDSSVVIIDVSKRQLVSRSSYDSSEVIIGVSKRQLVSRSSYDS